MKFEQWANKKEKLSRKQRIYTITAYVLLAFFILDLSILIYSVRERIIWATFISALILAFDFVFCIIVSNLEENEFKRVTNQSVEYYKRTGLPFIVLEPILSLSFFSIIIVFFTNTKLIKFDLGILYPICIGTFSLIPVIYIFILPQVKIAIESTKKDLKSVLTKLSFTKEIPNIKLLKKKQGDIYSLITSNNRMNSRLIVSTSLFTISIISFFFSQMNHGLTQALTSISILYSLYEILLLINLSYSSYSYNKKEFEKKMKEQISSIENKEKRKHAKELLKTYSRNGILCGENTRENCLKKKFADYYKTAYLIVKNEKNNYFIYHQILDYDRCEYAWKAVYNCDELVKYNLQTSFRKEIKNNFGFYINKNNFTLISKFINEDKHQIIEFYLLEDEIRNSNIDYNIDLYLNAKFVSFFRFFKILKSNKVIPDYQLEDIYKKLNEFNKK